VPALSIIIPCLGDAAEFDGTLVSVLQHRPADCEVIVVHRLPYDDPYDLGDEVRFLHWPGNSLVELLNAAIAEAEGDVLHVLACGLEATDHWTSAALDHFEDPGVAAVAPVVFEAKRQAIASAGIRWTIGGRRREVTDRRVLKPGSGRLRSQIMGPTLVAGFYRREVLAALDGFEAAMGDELADVACSLALQGLERIAVFVPDSQLVQVSRPLIAARGPLWRGKALERLFWRGAAQRGLATSLAMHGLSALADAVSQGVMEGVLSFSGRCLAVADLAAGQRYQQTLSTAESRLAELAALRTKRRQRMPVATTTLRKAA
jgi:hypothetical protein